MGKAKRAVKKKEKKKRVHRTNKNKLWEVVDGKVVRTNKECPRCGKGVFLAKHYSRETCGKCGYTKFPSRAATSTATTVGGVKTSTRRRKKLQK